MILQTFVPDCCVRPLFFIGHVVIVAVVKALPCRI